MKNDDHQYFIYSLCINYVRSVVLNEVTVCSATVKLVSLRQSVAYLMRLDVLSNGYRGGFPPGDVKMMELCIHFPIRLHGVVLNQLSPRINLRLQEVSRYINRPWPPRSAVPGSVAVIRGTPETVMAGDVRGKNLNSLTRLLV
jgi:hypothetical protein